MIKFTVEEWAKQRHDALKKHYCIYFNNEQFWYEWDFHLNDENVLKKAKHCEQIANRLWNSFGLRFKDIQKFVYGYVWSKTHIYFAFVLKDNEIFHLTWCKKRNQIGQMLNRFCGYKVIIWYPKFNDCRYYIPNQYPWGVNCNCSLFHGHKRVKQEEFK